MKILIDTNILISALFYPYGKPAKALFHAAANHELILTDHNISEFRTIANEKFKDRQADVDLFLAKLSYELVPAPEAPQKLIADPKDVPILNAAIIAGVEIIISGDNHFLTLDLKRPKTLKAAEYLQYVGAE